MTFPARLTAAGTARRRCRPSWCTTGLVRGQAASAPRRPELRHPGGPRPGPGQRGNDRRRARRHRHRPSRHPAWRHHPWPRPGPASVHPRRTRPDNRVHRMTRAPPRMGHQNRRQAVGTLPTPGSSRASGLRAAERAAAAAVQAERPEGPGPTARKGFLPDSTRGGGAVCGRTPRTSLGMAQTARMCHRSPDR